MSREAEEASRLIQLAMKSVEDQRRIVKEIADMLHICLGCGNDKRACACAAKAMWPEAVQ